MRQLATIREVKEIHPIFNPKDGKEAERIQLAIVDGWECVVNKSDGFHPGSKVVYIEIDSIVPPRPEFEFLKDRKYRVRTIRLRGQVSQGLVLPLSILPSGTPIIIGRDVTETLGVTKHDPELEEENKMGGSSKVSVPTWYKPLMKFRLFRTIWFKLHPKENKGFPEWIKKTDETRVQNLTRLFNDAHEKELEFDVREKIDGQSVTFFIQRTKLTLFNKNGYEFGVCSRNLRVPNDGSNNYSKIAKQLDIENVLAGILTFGWFGDNMINRIVLQGEIYGEGIQGNKYKKKGLHFAAFNLILDGRNIPAYEFEEFLERFDIKTVPAVQWEWYKLPATIPEIVEFSKGKSLLENRNREGIVVRNYDNDISFKVINPDFLLEEK